MIFFRFSFSDSSAANEVLLKCAPEKIIIEDLWLNFEQIHVVLDTWFLNAWNKYDSIGYNQ